MIEWRTEQRRLGDLLPWEKNPRQLTQRQAELITESLQKFGFADPIIVNTDDTIIGGHMRKRMLELLDEYGPDALVDVRVPHRQLDNDEVAELNVRLNKNTGEWDFDVLANEFNVDDLLDWGFEEWELGVSEEDFDSTVADKKPNNRRLPLDIIYTLQGADATCCLAVRAGWLYGIQSPTSRICPYWDKHRDGIHQVQFIDNEYTEYNHEAHVAMCKEHRPKYATVRDVMTEAQCKEAGIEYYSLEQILDYASEVADYAENVIVIPKYDCLDKIPDKYMLGYSIPTSHGGTPLDVEMFQGRRVHLLGGSWKKQLNYLAALGDDVVSLDNNYIAKQALFASFVRGDGSTGALKDYELDCNNPRYVSLAMSLGMIAQAVYNLYGDKHEDDE